jgi:hypothetical protein
VLSASLDGRAVVWDLASGSLLLSLLADSVGEWLAITPGGFFAASRRGTEMLRVVRGLEAYSVEQFYKPLYRPDLIAEVLKLPTSDPEGKYADAASKLNLEKILDSARCLAGEWQDPTRSTLCPGAVSGPRPADRRFPRSYNAVE